MGQRAAKLWSVKLGGRSHGPGLEPWPPVVHGGPSGGIFSDLQIGKLVALKPFDLQTPTIPLWKDINLAIHMLSDQNSNILNYIKK